MKKHFLSLTRLIAAFLLSTSLAHANSITPGSQVFTGSAVGQIPQIGYASNNDLKGTYNFPSSAWSVTGATTLNTQIANQWDAGTIPVTLSGNGTGDTLTQTTTIGPSNGGSYTFSGQFSTSTQLTGVTTATTQTKITVQYTNGVTRTDTFIFNPSTGQLVSASSGITAANIQLFSTTLYNSTTGMTQTIPVIAISFTSANLTAATTGAVVTITPNNLSNGLKQVVVSDLQFEFGALSTAFIPTGIGPTSDTSRPMGTIPQQIIDRNWPAHNMVGSPYIFEPIIDQNTVMLVPNAGVFNIDNGGYTKNQNGMTVTASLAATTGQFTIVTTGGTSKIVGPGITAAGVTSLTFPPAATAYPYASITLVYDLKNDFWRVQATSAGTTSGGGGGTPGGANTNVQYNNAGAFGGNSGFDYNGTSQITLGVTGASTGSIGMGGATSGTNVLTAPATAGGTQTLPNVSGTVLLDTTTATMCTPTLNGILSISSTAGTGTIICPATHTWDGTKISVNPAGTTLSPFIAGTVFQGAAATGSNASIELDSATVPSVISLARANTTLASPSAVINGDIMGRVGFVGYNSAAYTTGADLIGVATQTWTASALGSEFRVRTTPNGSTVLRQSLTVGQDGAVSLGTAGSYASALNFNNATSGTITLSPATGALGTPTITIPAVTANMGLTTGALTNGNCAKFDASGRIVDAATTCGGGAGTVTSVSVTTANGVSGTVATATTTPAISLTLGAITPSSVASSGAVSGTNLTASASLFVTGTETVAAGTNAQGQGNMSASVYQTLLTNASGNPGGATLPAAVAGLRKLVSNTATASNRQIRIYPASGDDLGLGANTSTLLPQNSTVEYVAAGNSPARWYATVQFAANQTANQVAVSPTADGAVAYALAAVIAPTTGYNNQTALLRITNATVSTLCTSPGITANGSNAGVITVGSACTGVQQGTLTLPAATTGWACQFTSIGSPGLRAIRQVGGSTTTALFSDYTQTTGLIEDFTAGDTIRFMCMGY